MSRLERVETDGQADAYMSLVPWGPLRRWLAGRKARRLSIKMIFVPKYELAVFHDHPNRTLPNMPDLVFRFRDKPSALEGYHKVAEALIAGGYWGDPVRALLDVNQQEWLGN
jgi:hypothetical protein